jgi:hypothetical protein
VPVFPAVPVLSPVFRLFVDRTGNYAAVFFARFSPPVFVALPFLSAS